MSNPTIYIMAIDRGCEGHSPPVQAFTDYGEAKAAMAIVNSDLACSGWKLYRVPVWPEAASPYMDIKPLEIDR